MTTRLIAYGCLISIATIAALFVSVGTARANPSSIQEFRSAAATTTVTYMTPGTATTTKAVDLQADNAPADTAALVIRFSASSSQSVLKWRYEYAQRQDGVDCVANQSLCDWFSESVNTTAATATTTVEVQTFREYSWTFASSTPGAIGLGFASTSDTGFKMITVPTPTRFVRVILYLAPGTGAGNGSVWYDLVTKRENR